MIRYVCSVQCFMADFQRFIKLMAQIFHTKSARRLLGFNISIHTSVSNKPYHHFILITNWRKPQNYFALMDASRRFPSNKKIFVTSTVSSLFLYKLLTFVTRFSEFPYNKNTYRKGIQFSYITYVKVIGIGIPTIDKRKRIARHRASTGRESDSVGYK